MADTARDVFFICYSHTDTSYKQRFDKFLHGERFRDRWELFSDSQIRPGENWQQRILDSLQKASAALLLVSQDFMVSPFIQQVELRDLLAGHIRRGLRLFLVPVRATNYRGTYLERFQWARSPDKPLSLLREEEQEQAMVEVCQLISNTLARPADDASQERQVECFESIPKLDLPPIYELQGAVAEGEFARCYLARDRLLEQNVIIKVLNEDLTRDSPAYDKYVLSAARLKHRNILGVLFCQTSKRPHFLVTPCIEGGTIAERLGDPDPTRRPSLETVMNWTLQLANALQYAHARGCVHGRLRPSEVRIDAEEQVMLSGFRTYEGLRAPCVTAKRSLEDFWYASPETRTTGRMDAKNDQYLLGLLAYEMIAGAQPIDLTSWATVLEPACARAIHQPRPLHEFVPECRQEVSDAILRALAVDPAQRWPDLTVFAQALENLLCHTASTRAKESYRRCAQKNEFYESVYAHLFAALPEARAMFGADLERQYKVLRDAIWLLLSFADTNETEEPTILSGVARSHFQRTAQEYDQFREAILAAVRDHDTAAAVEDWRTTMLPGFEYLKHSLAKAAPHSELRSRRAHAATG
jgi:serine/threonine protein kinase